MTVIAPRRRRIKKATGYKMPIDIEQELNAMVERGEYTSRAEAISVGVRFWVAFRHFDVKQALVDLLSTPEGQQILLDAMKKARTKK